MQILALVLACVPALLALTMAILTKRAAAGVRGVFILAGLSSLTYAGLAWRRVSALEGGLTPFGTLVLGVFATIVLFYAAVCCVLLLLIVSYARTGQSLRPGGLGSAALLAGLIWAGLRYGPILLGWGAA